MVRVICCRTPLSDQILEQKNNLYFSGGLIVNIAQIDFILPHGCCRQMLEFN